MGFKVDFSEVEKYIQSLKLTQNDFNKFLSSFLVEMADRVLEKTIPKTPVKTGTLKRSWKLGELKGSGKEISIEIKNPMEYATEIEYGHVIKRNNVEIGWYEGRFMLKSSIDEIKRQLPLRYEEKFARFCMERGLNVN